MKRRIRTLPMLVLAAGIAIPALARAAQAPLVPMPHTTVDHPEFAAASEATFLQDDDILLGVTSGKVAKAFPAADLAQHGAVLDQLPDGPISVTWCVVCNTGLVFRAEVKGRVLHFRYDRMVAANEVQKDLETGTSGRETVAYPFSALRIARVVNDRVGGLPIVIVHQPSSDTPTAYEARSKGKVLTFEPANHDASAVTDRETRSTWNAYGLCLEGPLKGTQLKQVILVSQFWFAWSQFRQGTRVFTAR